MGDILERNNMTINLYKTLSEVNKVTKTLTDEISLTGTLRDVSSVMNPRIIIEEDNISDYNYAYIPDFGRYYFITNIDSVRNNIWNVSMRCDVLMTYADEIKNNTAVIARNSNLWNLYYQDEQFKILNYETIQTKAFGVSLNPSSQIVLICAGG
jgi:hypothetical protein